MIEDQLSDPQTLERPYAYFDRLRAEAPVYYAQSLNSYFVTRYADAQFVMNNPEIFRSTPGDSTDFMANFSPKFDPIYHAAGVPSQRPSLVTTDGDVHRRYRSHVDHAFSASAVRAMEPKVTALVDQLIDPFIDLGEVDLYTDFCLLLPLYVICDVLGLPRTDAAFLQEVADGSVRLAAGGAETSESRVALHELQVKFHLYLREHINRVRAQPDDTLLSTIVHTIPTDQIQLQEDEVMSLASVLNVGGNETTTNGLANMFLLCFAQPGLEERLRADRALVPKFVEEALRIESTVAAMPRWCAQDTTVGGVTIPAGAVVQVSFSAANRDPQQFPSPTQIDTARKGLRNHMAFGTGVHYCLGAMLARMELRIAMNRVLDRMSQIAVKAPRPLHRPKLLARALSHLPVSFEKALVPDEAIQVSAN